MSQQSSQAGQKRYKVARTFTDKSGKTWQQGQEYSGDEAEAKNQANQGNLEETSSGEQSR